MRPIHALAAALATLGVSDAACIDTPGVNLITNGGFENDPVSFAPWSTGDKKNVAKIARPGAHSRQSLDLLPSKGKTESVHQSINDCAATWYTIAWDLRLPANEVSFSILVETLAIGFSPYDATQTNWSHHAFNYYVTHTESGPYFGPPRLVLFEFSSSTKDRLLLDNVEVTALGDIAPKPGAKELVVNGGVETGQLPPWEFGPQGLFRPVQCQVERPGYRSRFAIYCRTTTFKGYVFDNLYLQQQFDTVPMTQYLMTGKLKIRQHNPNLTVEDCPIQFFFMGYDFDVNGFGLTPPNDTWTDIYLPFIAQSDFLTFEVYMFTNKDTGIRPRCLFMFDDISVKESGL